MRTISYISAKKLKVKLKRKSNRKYTVFPGIYLKKKNTYIHVYAYLYNFFNSLYQSL